ncbi:MAG TPA: RNA polymerase factor sigma-54 [Bacteroidia bacterium]|nr:RNA polymerase factor sigma-54 [Bacteroidia bacterium]
MLRQGLQQKMLQRLSPQQIQLMKLLQVPVFALEQRIKEELQNNPALEEGKEEEADDLSDEEKLDEQESDETNITEREEDFNIDEYIQDDEIPDYKTASHNTGSDEERREAPVVSGNSFQEQLLTQLHLCDFDDRQYHLAEQLIGSMDDDGYLRRDLNAMVDDLAFSQNIQTSEQELQEILGEIQSFDPPGIGARTLQECLLLQLLRKDDSSEAFIHAEKILADFMDEYTRKHYEKIMLQMGITEEQLKTAHHEILKLNPRPGNSEYEGRKSIQHIIPDFIIFNNDGVLELSLNSKNAPELRLSKEYKEMLDHYVKEKKKKNGSSNSAKEAVSFVRQKIDAAKWFIDAMKTRQNTLYSTMKTMMDYQYEYFLDGDQKKLRPMVLRDIAQITGLDISTVSRVSNSKYVQTPFGTFLLKSFFSEAMQTESGEEVSSKEVKQILSDSVAAEDKRKPVTDDALAAILKEKGYPIARRTVAKYREMLGIPVARLRKQL